MLVRVLRCQPYCLLIGALYVSPRLLFELDFGAFVIEARISLVADVVLDRNTRTPNSMVENDLQRLSPSGKTVRVRAYLQDGEFSQFLYHSTQASVV